MPLNVPDNLPAIEILKEENIFVMPESKAMHQDIRPLKIIILNLMPVKITTEIHLLRMLSNTPLQAEVMLMNIRNHVSKNTPKEHLEEFYMTFDQVKDKKFDGLIITGAPVEMLDFDQVDYWDEMKEIMDWADHHVTSTLYICWAAQAGLFHHYGIPKYPEDKKIFGVFKHWINEPNEHIVRGFDDEFWVPHSRHTNLQRSDLEKVSDLQIIAESVEAGVHIIASRDGKRIFVTGHSEYDPLTLKLEYERDKSKGLPIDVPKNYFPADDPAKVPVVRWKSHASLFYSNWLNYYVYQATPFALEDIK